MKGYFSILRNFSFKGRSSRREFWAFNIINLIILALLMILIPHEFVKFLFHKLPDDPNALTITFPILFIFSIFIQTFAVSVRRLHDINLSGWWSLVAFTGIGLFPLAFLFLLNGTIGYNQFGADPRGRHPVDLEPIDLEKIQTNQD